MRSSLQRRAPTLLRTISRRSQYEAAIISNSPRPAAAATRPAAVAPQKRWHSSVNADEISHFNALASTWWDPHGSSRALHLMNPLRHDFINTCRSTSLSSSTTVTPEPNSQPTAGQQQQHQAPKLRYLDVGCGGGIFAESAARLPSTHSVTAIDAAPVIIQVARQHASKDPLLAEPTKLRYINTTIENLASTLQSSPEESKFDVVTLFEVIEHVDQPANFLSHLSNHVKPGGWLVLSTIARTWTSWFTTNFMAEDVLGIVPKGTHDWNKYINDDELRGYFSKFADEQGWDLSSLMVQGVVYVPGLGWKEVQGSEKVGNYFLGVQKKA
ncbi:hexaprenyldihydroxybenzoate methyltransferase [Rhypophila decipiens]